MSRALDPYRARLTDPEPEPARLCYAATRIVMKDAYADVRHSLEHPGTPEEIARYVDWEATASLRTRLDSLGFGIAEAMDTAQRFDIGWHTAKRLVQMTGELGLANGFCAGAGVDHLGSIRGPDDLVEGVCHQARDIQSHGGEVILLPLAWLSIHGVDEATYVETYTRIIERLDGPLFVHWLGPMFLSSLEGYFPGESFRRIMEFDPTKVRGAKLSMLDAELEIRLRADLLTRDQLMLTGDDFHFAGLIQGGDGVTAPKIERTTRVGDRVVPLGDFSHALLGVLDGIAEPASVALRFLSRGDVTTYAELMEPCEELGRSLFEAPTQHYKAGLARLSHALGLQSNDLLANHQQRERGTAHYDRVLTLAREARLGIT